VLIRIETLISLIVDKNMNREDEKYLKWLMETYQVILAAYLNKTALIEDKIDEIISECFLEKSKNKWKYINIILSDIPFGSKTKKIERSLKETQPELAKSFLNEKLSDRLEKIRKRRNIFAHSILNRNPKYLSKKRKDEIALLNPRDTQPHTPIKLKDFNDWNQDAKKVLELLASYLVIIEKQK
jgi:hypothetical protein